MDVRFLRWLEDRGRWGLQEGGGPGCAAGDTWGTRGGEALTEWGWGGGEGLLKRRNLRTGLGSLESQCLLGGDEWSVIIRDPDREIGSK